MAVRQGELATKFWGVRGSIPCPGKLTSKYGGNTSCIEILGGSDIIVLDAGTGIRELGLELVKTQKALRIHILLSHTHWDHIQGFPFFTPIYFPGNEIFIYGPRALEKSLEEALMFQLQYSYFPVRGVELAARVKFTELDEESFKIGDIEFTSRSMNHPIRVLAYKFSRDGRTGVYTGDNEPYYDVLATKTSRIDTGVHRRGEFIRECNDRVVEFVSGSNLLVADAQYTEEEYGTKRGWGHSSVTHAIDLAVNAEVERLALFHHEPGHMDKDMDQIHKRAVAEAKKRNRKMEVFTAREGMTIRV